MSQATRRIQDLLKFRTKSPNVFNETLRNRVTSQNAPLLVRNQTIFTLLWSNWALKVSKSPTAGSSASRNTVTSSSHLFNSVRFSSQSFSWHNRSCNSSKNSPQILVTLSHLKLKESENHESSQQYHCIIDLSFKT